MDATTQALIKYNERQRNILAERNLLAFNAENPKAKIASKLGVVGRMEQFSDLHPEEYAGWRKDGGGLVRKYRGGPGERRFYDPTETDVHVDAVMTGLSIQYGNDTYIAEQVFPILPVKKESDRFFTYVIGDWLRDEAGDRAAGGASPSGGYTTENSSNYNCVEKSFETTIPWRVRDNSDSPLDADRDAVDFVTEKMMLNREIRVANAITSITNIGSGTTPTNLWSNFATSDPISDVRTGQAFIKENVGKSPNTGIIGWNVLQTLVDHPLIVERIKYTDRADFAKAASALAGIFNLDRILVGDAMQENAQRGDSANSLTMIWGDNMVLAYVEGRPRPRSVTAGVTFATVQRRIRRGSDTRNKFDWVQGEEITDPRILIRNCLYAFTSVL